MKIIVTLALLLNICIPNFGEVKDIECNKKNEEILDLMIQRLYLFGAQDRKYQTNQKDMQKFCRSAIIDLISFSKLLTHK